MGVNYCWRCCTYKLGIGLYHKLFPTHCPKTCGAGGGW